MSRFTNIPQPGIGVGTEPSAITAAEYSQRIAAAQHLMAASALDFLVVYADREHFADLYFLTGVDPRFEEAIYVLGATNPGVLLLGNENLALWSTDQLGIEVLLYQELSPSGQTRDAPRQLSELLRSAGLGSGVRVGVTGGKQFGSGFVADPGHALSAPAYLVDGLRSLVGSTGDVVNAEELFRHPETGLRTVSSAHQIAHFEYGAAVASRSVMSAMKQVRVGAAANSLAHLLVDNGIAQSCHPMINFGSKQGLYSPSSNVAQLGDAFSIAYGLRGGLTCRAGVVASGPEDLAGPARSAFPELALNYFDVVCAWYEAIAVGATAGEVFAAAERQRNPAIFEYMLNPGHLLHLEEWSQSTFVEGDTTPLLSGSMVQCDIIPISVASGLHMNVEDGVALADSSLRNDLANDYPELWDRVQARRQYVTDVIGVTLHESVLPMSTMPLWHTPYALNPALALSR